MAEIRIDIISDIVCPWCYIGVRRLQKAIANLPEGEKPVLYFHPFELNPEIPKNGIDQREYLAEKFGGEEQYEKITAHTEAIAREEGLAFNYSIQHRLPNTRTAHRVIRFALEHGLQEATALSYYRAYFEEGVDLSKKENIVGTAVRAGLDAEEVNELLLSDRYHDEIERHEQEIYTAGIHAVPFFIINNKNGISGAQPTEVFSTALLNLQSR